MTTFHPSRDASLLRRAILSIVVSLLWSHSVCSQPGYRPELRPYVQFLDRQKTSAKDYILSLFANHDVVIICERHHPEITQYDLFLAIVSDPRFIDSVGSVFTEIGTITQAAEVNAFVHAEGLTADSVDQPALRFQRNCSDSPLWEKTNYFSFVRSLHLLNQGLPSSRKVDLFNSDVPFDWNTVDTAGLRAFQEHIADVRDSVIASQIIQKFDEIRKSRVTRRKALVIMNYRHAFRHDTKNPKGVTRRNVGRFLFDRYGERVANVYLNNLALVSARSDNDVSYAAIQGGRWDAAFKVTNARDVGFDFKNTPFGKDTFDIWPANVNWTWENEFDGFVFYLPLDEQKLVFGMAGLVDSAFVHELARRYTLYRPRQDGHPWTTADVEGMRHDCNVRREMPLDGLDSLNAEIHQWLAQ